jgi:hypothetical protein
MNSKHDDSGGTLSRDDNQRMNSNHSSNNNNNNIIINTSLPYHHHHWPIQSTTSYDTESFMIVADSDDTSLSPMISPATMTTISSNFELLRRWNHDNNHNHNHNNSTHDHNINHNNINHNSSDTTTSDTETNKHHTTAMVRQVAEQTTVLIHNEVQRMQQAITELDEMLMIDTDDDDDDDDDDNNDDHSRSATIISRVQSVDDIMNNHEETTHLPVIHCKNIIL